jgi:YD repeat-containing protein
VGRLATQTINADASYQYQYAYNSLGALHTITWPTSTSGVRVKAKYLYTNGVLTQIRQFTGDVDGPNLWSLNLLDAAGRATSEVYGNGLWVKGAFDPLTGQITSRRSGTGGSESNVQQLAYGWDEAGNLTTRQDLNQGLTETFGYDARAPHERHGPGRHAHRGLRCDRQHHQPLGRGQLHVTRDQEAPRSPPRAATPTATTPMAT